MSLDTDGCKGHTPAPLRVRRHHDNDLWSVADENDDLIMMTAFPDECSSGMTDGERYANAQLMAIAPDLLAELKQSRKDYKRVLAKYVAALDYVVEGYAYCEPCERGCFVEEFTDDGDDICLWCGGVIE